jgi:hypothetical protein
LDLSLSGTNKYWDASLNNTTLTIAPGNEMLVNLIVTAPTEPELNDYFMNIDSNASGIFNISEYLCGLRGYSDDMSSDLVFTTTYLKHEPSKPLDNGNGDVPGDDDGHEDEDDDEDGRDGIDVFIVIVIVIIAVIMGAVIRDLLAKRSQHKKGERRKAKDEKDKSDEEKPSEDELIEE